MKRSRNILSLDTDSALALMQEIYNDVVEQKSIASLITKKMLSFMKEAEDMSVIGPVIKEQQKILNDCVEKKISLVKLQSVLLKQMGNGNSQQMGGKLDLTEEDRILLEKLMDDGNESTGTQKYDV
jgi:hypothetical protein